MARIFITGSADGLGKMAAQLLIAQGHHVVLHARNEARAKEAIQALPGAEAALVGDLSSIKENILLAERVNALGEFDAVIHNAAMGYRESKKTFTAEGLQQLFMTNSLSPYILTCLVKKPERVVYTSSALHRQGDPSLNDLNWVERPWNGLNAYSDSKLHNLILSLAVARKWQAVFSNAVEPGWVATKMGGPAATDSLSEGPKSQAWLAASQDEEVRVTGHYFYHQEQKAFNPVAANIELQEKFLSECERLCGIGFPN